MKLRSRREVLVFQSAAGLVSPVAVATSPGLGAPRCASLVELRGGADSPLRVKGLLSFMSAPLIGALSDVWGRRSFLLVTVFFTCAPIPLMRLSPW